MDRQHVPRLVPAPIRYEEARLEELTAMAFMEEGFLALSSPMKPRKVESVEIELFGFKRWMTHEDLQMWLEDVVNHLDDERATLGKPGETTAGGMS